MKEPENSQVSTIDHGRKMKKRKGGLSLATQSRGDGKKEQSSTQGSDPPKYLSRMDEETETWTYSRNKELERIEEEAEKGGSQEQSMGESEHLSDSDSNESEEETKEDSMGTVSLVLRIKH